MALGLDNPILRFLLSQAQASSSGLPVHRSDALGLQSTAQRSSTGNQFETARERIKKALAARGVISTSKVKKSKKSKPRKDKVKPKPKPEPTPPPGELDPPGPFGQ